MNFRRLINIVEDAKIIPFPGHKKEPEQETIASYTQVLDAAPEEFEQVVNIAKIYKSHKDLWFKNHKELDREIAMQALSSLKKWADYFDYDEVENMLAVLEHEKVI